MADEKTNGKHLLSDEELEGISGGIIVNAMGHPEYDQSFPWLVVANNSGQVLGQFRSMYDACAYAKSFGKDPYNAQEIPWNAFCNLRANPNT